MKRVALPICILASGLALLVQHPAQARTVSRTIVADMHAVTGPRDLFWQDCVGADHGPLMLRAANQRQLRMVQREIGFKYVRFHGILTHTHVYRESHGAPIYDFSEVDSIYAAVLTAGMKPLLHGRRPLPAAARRFSIGRQAAPRPPTTANGPRS